MNIRTEPLFGAAAFGIVVAFIYTLIDTVVGYSQSPPSYTAFGSTGSCLITLISGLGTGILYAVLYQRQAPVTTADGAKGGAAAGGLALLISGVFSVIIILLILPDVLAQGFAARGLSADLASEAQGFALGGALIASGGAACGLALVGALMGAVGGVIGASVSSR